MAENKCLSSNCVASKYQKNDFVTQFANLLSIQWDNSCTENLH